MRRRAWQYAVVLCGATALVLTGCAADSAPENNATVSEQTETAADAGDAEAQTQESLEAADIVAVIEPQGFECTIEEARLDSRDEVVACKGDDYVIISATSLVDPSAMADEIAHAKDAVCKNQETLGVDAMRTAISGEWVFTPGGDDDKNLAAFDTAMKSFGLEWTEDPC